MKPVRKFKVMFILSCILLFLFICWSEISISSQGSVAALEAHSANKMCFVNLNDKREHLKNIDGSKIFYVTPTYPRPEQIPELTRLSQTLMHVPNIHWIVADDQPLCSDEVLNVLTRSGLPFTHLSSPTPYPVKRSRAAFPRGVANRMAALAWIRDNAKEGVLYFGDDDNTVDLRLFAEIRATRRVGVLPVGLIGGYGVSAPVVVDGKVTGFFDSWPAKRTFPIDMAGFAVNLAYLKPEARMPYEAGYEEDKFLVSLDLKLEDMEPLADNCTKILVWHTRTLSYKKPTVHLNLDEVRAAPQYGNFADLLMQVEAMSMVDLNPNKGAKAVITRNRKSYSAIDLIKG